MKDYYEIVDEAVMGCAHKTVQAWNWMTGKTKYDLAATLQYIAPCSEVVLFRGPIVNVLAPISLGLSLSLSMLMMDYEKREKVAKEKEILDGDMEQEKVCFKYGMCPGLGVIASLSVGEATQSEDEGWYGFAAGMSLRCASSYIIRADDFPPRKNCISRGIDHARKGLESLMGQEQPQPA